MKITVEMEDAEFRDAIRDVEEPNEKRIKEALAKDLTLYSGLQIHHPEKLVYVPCMGAHIVCIPDVQEA